MNTALRIAKYTDQLFEFLSDTKEKRKTEKDRHTRQ